MCLSCLVLEVEKKYLPLHLTSLETIEIEKTRQNRRYGENERERLAKTVSTLVEKDLLKKL
jgi:hypothetical protein